MDPSTYSAPRTFPPIKQLFKESWDNLIAKLLPVFIFNTIVLGIAIGVGILLFLVLLGTTSLTSQSNTLLTTTLPIILLLIVWTIALLLIFLITQIGNILVLSGNTTQPSYKGIIKQSLTLALPLMFGQFLVSFIVLGGLVLFVIPGIIFALFFQFVVFLIVLDRLKPKEALKRSAFLVSRAFGQVFIRVAILSVVPFGFSFALNVLSGYSLDEGSSGIINSLFSLFYSLFAISYSLTLFKQVKAYSGEGLNNIRFLGLMAIIGWIIAIALIFLGFRTLGAIAPALNTATSNLPTTLPSISDDELLLDDEEFISTPTATPISRISPVPTPLTTPAPVSTTSATPR